MKWLYYRQWDTPKRALQNYMCIEMCTLCTVIHFPCINIHKNNIIHHPFREWHLFPLRIPDMVQQKFISSHQDSLKKLEEKISQDTTIQKAIQAMTDSNGSSQATQSRTLATPQWDNNPPVNFRKGINLAVISVADFDANNTYHPFVYLSVCVLRFFVCFGFIPIHVPFRIHQ